MSRWLLLFGLLFAGCAGAGYVLPGPPDPDPHPPGGDCRFDTDCKTGKTCVNNYCS